MGSIEHLMPRLGVLYYRTRMKPTWRVINFPGDSRTAPWAVLAFVILLMGVVPVLDLAWNDSTLDEGHGARCQLHANPVVPLELASLIVTHCSEFSPLSDPLAHVPLRDASIFVPPRA